MLKRLRLSSKGDTIVEVLLASVILSIVLAGAYSLSTRATRLNQSAYERTVASNLVQEQAELLRAAHDEDDEAWILIAAQPETQYYDCRNANADIPPDTTLNNNLGMFYLDGVDGELSVNSASTKASEDIYHTWIARKPSTSSQFVDFYIYSCWEGLGAIGNQVTGAVVRLEEQ